MRVLGEHRTGIGPHLSRYGVATLSGPIGKSEGEIRGDVTVLVQPGTEGTGDPCPQPRRRGDGQQRTQEPEGAHQRRFQHPHRIGQPLALLEMRADTFD